MKNDAQDKQSRSVFQTILLVICVAGTIAFAVFILFFAIYYAQNSEKLVVADIQYQRINNDPQKPMFTEVYGEVAALQAGFQWGGCRPLNLMQQSGTFSLHCWGLARGDSSSFVKEISKRIDSEPKKTASLSPYAAPSPVKPTFVSIPPLDAAKKTLSLFAAYSYEKLHLDMTSNDAPRQQK